MLTKGDAMNRKQMSPWIGWIALLGYAAVFGILYGFR
jgi:hypothetical protein